MSAIAEQKEEIIEEWLRRLESGEVPQCQGILRRGDMRCVFGVLGDVLEERELAVVHEYYAICIAPVEESPNRVVPPEVYEALGLSHALVILLMEKNDYNLTPFQELAATLRSMLAGNYN
jgi:hypothetical protein